MSVKKRLNFPILLRLSVLMMVLLASIAGVIAWKNATFFEQVSSQREESVNLIEVKTHSYQVETLILMFTEKLKSYSIDLKREESSTNVSQILQQKFNSDLDIVGLEILTTSSDRQNVENSIFNEDFLTQNKLTNEIFSDKNNDDLIRVFDGELRVERFFNTIPLLQISMPFLKDDYGNYSHVVIGYFKVDKIQKSFSDLTDRNIFVIDAKGHLVSHPDEKRVLAGEDLKDDVIVKDVLSSKLMVRQKYTNDKKDTPVLEAFSKTPYGLTVISTTDESFIKMPSEMAKNQSIFWLGMILSGAFFLIFLLSTSITNPIEKLLYFTKEIASGNFDIEASRVIKSRDELGSLALAFDDMTSGLKERDKIKDMFGKFTGAGVADELLQSELTKKGSKKDVVVYFSDIRGFTDFSERHPAEEVVEMLNEYFEIMVGIIIKNGGVVDKFIGDAVMAVWGVPDKSKADAHNCIKACLEMRVALVDFNKRRIAKNKEPIKVGMGVHCGEVISGTIGSSLRMEYTVIGDNVNTAARIEASTKAFGTDLLVSEQIARRTQHQYLIRKAGSVEVKGKAEGFTLFTIHGFKGANGERHVVETPYSSYKAEGADKVKVG